MGIESGSSQALCPAVDDVAAGPWPPGFRFHPTDEELVLYYLKKKICRRRIKLDIIRETDVYKWDPEELPGQSMLKTGDRQWFFFSPRDRKYPNAARSNRATRHGYWKATGKDRNITCNSRSVGVKKTLVFYRGRAPNGERTDWVMHEYTLDEDELSRCKNVQDYYALYKVFKKSGPGPKNGEQYGAPFKEEEWAEDDYVDVLQSLGQGIAAKPLNEVTCFENSKVDSTMQPSLAELEQFMNCLADEPSLGELQVHNHLCMVPKVVEDEAQSILADSSPREIVFPEPINVFQSSAKQCNAPASFDITQSATSQLQSYEASEVTSAPDNFNHTFDISEEGFLEMDDLIGPEPTSSNNAENVPFEEMDGLGEIDVFLDSTMFFHDMGPIYQGVSHPDVNTLDNDLLNYQLESYMVDQLSYQTQPDDMASQINRSSHPDNMANQLNFQLPPNDMANQFDYTLQADDMVNQLSYSLLPNADVSDQISSQFWIHDQRGEVTLSELNQGTVNLPTSGVMHESSHHMPNNVNPGTSSGQQPVATTSRFSSALWSFVESIPTAPASAAESALVNRAFERMSSFSRVRINATMIANVDPNRAVTRRAAPRNKGLIIFSIIGAICAILWVLMGSIRLWGRCISSW